MVTISFDEGDDSLVMSKSNIETLTIQDHDTNIRKSSIRRSGIISPDDETVIKEKRTHNKRYSKDSGDYDSEEDKDKVPVDDFVPMIYQEEINSPFNGLDLTEAELG